MTATCGPARVVLAGDAAGDPGREPSVQDPEVHEPIPDLPEVRDLPLEEEPELPACTNPMPDDCLELSTRLWPSAADAGDTCEDNRGNLHPSTGEDSAEWFDYIDCGTWKEFTTDPCTWVLIRARGDMCSGCVLWHIGYVLEEKVDDGWVSVQVVDPEPDFRGMTDDQCYLTATGRFRIRAVDGFYVRVFQE